MSPVPERINLPEAYPPGDDENSADYTRRLLSHAREAGTFRQCSIGYHNECSDQDGESCMCSCHALGVEITRDQLEAWAGRALTDEEVMRIEEAIPNSGIPESIATITDNLDTD